MRNVFLVLVLVNLGFAAWHQWFAPRPAATRTLSRSGPQIALVAEARPARAAPSAPVASSDTIATESLDVPLACVSIGPFPNRVVVGDVVRALDAAGFSAAQRIAQGDVWLGYWVYIDAIPTQAEAAEIVGRLNEIGIGEAYVIADGNRGSIVSLGVFSAQARAEQRLTEARSLGYAPIVVDRSQPGDVYWLDVSASDGSDLTAETLLDLLDPESVQTVDCAQR